MTKISITPLSGALGAEIFCDDFLSITKTEGQELRQALLDHLFILIRGQCFTDQNLVAFTDIFGELKSPLTASQRAANVSPNAHPDVSVISNVVENGITIGSLGDGEAEWHTDYNFDETPYAAAMLHALEIPPHGGDTSWSNMYLACDTLPTRLREKIDGLTIKHDTSYNAAGILRRGFSAVTDVCISPGPSHPIIRTHPETGYNCLYLGRRLHAYVNGITLEESNKLLDELWAHAVTPAFQWRHQWKVGDIIVWDNRCTMHHRQEFDGRHRRIMHKTQTRGDRPFCRDDNSKPHPRSQF